MTGFETDVLQGKLCNNCDCTGFAPILTFVTSASAKTVVVTDASTFGAGDSFLHVNIQVYDKKGKQAIGQITAAAGVATIDVSALDLTLLDVKATVVSTAGCKTDLGTYNIPSPSTGSLLNKAYQGNRKPTKV